MSGRGAGRTRRAKRWLRSVLAGTGVACAGIGAVAAPQAGPATALPGQGTPAASRPQAQTAITRPSGLIYQVVHPGHGLAAVPGQHVTIHETTTSETGTLIYSTRTKGRPLTFLLGGKQVVDGVDEGVTGMRVGERRRLIVPPALGKRRVYPANIPPDATLHYDIELVGIDAPQARP